MIQALGSFLPIPKYNTKGFIRFVIKIQKNIVLYSMLKRDYDRDIIRGIITSKSMAPWRENKISQIFSHNAFTYITE